MNLILELPPLVSLKDSNGWVEYAELSSDQHGTCDPRLGASHRPGLPDLPDLPGLPGLPIEY
ncbi:hypothetical protein D4764_06G0013170 [Takifugu flavidus]|uniref:Uncharacterized protein n=1 Tax=Takifugu flavidus TaxID=433684 RepID=A0A5C6N296_9TELE|nr:hypothetical protein D4764_06G0013170 [Takifugu flavidus]